ncbi:MAG: DMT family transporter [Pseudomonadota bacterium]
MVATEPLRPVPLAPNALKAMGLMAVAAFNVALVTLLVRLATDTGLHPFVVAFFRNLFGVMLLLPLALRAGRASFRTPHLHLHALRGGLQTVAMLGWFYGITIIPMATVAALSFTAPLFATLLAVLVLGEVVGVRRWAALAAGFLGTLIILRPGADVVDPGALYVLLAACAWGSVMIVVKVLGRIDTSLTLTLYGGFFLVPFTLVPALFVWSWPTAQALILLVAIAAVASLSQLCVAQAFKLADTSVVLPVDFTKLIWGAAIGYLVYTEIPDWGTFVGGAVIFASVVYVAYRERRQRAATR